MSVNKYEYLKSVIERLHDEGKITDKEYKIFLETITEIQEGDDGR